MNGDYHEITVRHIYLVPALTNKVKDNFAQFKMLRINGNYF